MSHLVVWPASILEQRAEECEPTAPGSLQVAGEMLTVLAEMPGAAAVAANQVGSRLAGFAYRDPENGPTVVWNPRISDARGKQTEWEGCLSFPDEQFLVTRPRSLVLTADDILGEPVRVVARNFRARMFAHEVDHLRGVLVTARAKARRSR